MKIQSPLLRSIGALLALLVLVAFPPSAWADHGPCDDPYCELYYGTGHDLSLELGTDNPTGATIFYITSIDQPIPSNVNPCHNGVTPCQGTGAVISGSKISIPYGHTLWVKMIAWKATWQDSGVVECEQHNPNV